MHNHHHCAAVVVRGWPQHAASMLACIVLSVSLQYLLSRSYLYRLACLLCRFFSCGMVSKWWHARFICRIWGGRCCLHEGKAATSDPRFLKSCSIKLRRASICRRNRRRRIHHRPGDRRCRNSSGCTLRPHHWWRRLDGENTTTLVCACVRVCACVHACVRACVRACMRACVHACVRAYVLVCVIECLWLRACVWVYIYIVEAHLRSPHQ